MNFTPTGTVRYSFYANGNCEGDSVSSNTVDVSAGNVPASDTTDPLGGGTYSFDAHYSGDSNYTSVTSACEPFTVDPADPAASTTVFDAAKSAAWSGTEVTGATAYDTSTVTGVEGFTPTGTVTYTLYSGGTCTRGTTSDTAPSAHAVISTDTVTLAGGIVPNSSTTSPLGAGSYSYGAVYSGDSNYVRTVMTCEPFTVGKAIPTTATVVFDASDERGLGRDRGQRGHGLRHLDGVRRDRVHTERHGDLHVLWERDLQWDRLPDRGHDGQRDGPALGDDVGPRGRELLL